MYCRRYLRQIGTENEMQSDEGVSEQSEEEDFKVRNAINDEWNAEVAKIREIRLADQRAKRRDFILQHLLREEQWQEMKKEKLNAWVRKAKEDSVTFITAENVDAAIEECLTNVVNYNYALDLNGNWHEEKYPPTPPVEETQKPATVERQN